MNMRKFLVLPLILVVIATGGIQAARLLGSRENPPLMAQVFTNPDGSPCEIPCVFGIQHRKTTHEEAVDLLKAHPLTQKATITVDGRTTIVQDSTLYAVFHEDGLHRVELDTLTMEGLTLATAVVILGVPDCVVFGRQESMNLLYSRYTMNLRISDPLYNPFDPFGIPPDRFRADMETPDFSVRDDWRCPSEFRRRDFRISRMASWQGFASFARYDAYIRNHP
jgi:hypothetical protein